MRKWIFLFPFVAVAFSLSSQESQTTSFDLKGAQDYAVKSSFKVKMAQVDYEMAAKQMAEIRAIGLPQISAEGSFQNFIDIPTTVLPNFVGQAISAQIPGVPAGPEFIEAQFGTNYNTSAKLNASQLIFDGAYFIGLKAAKAYTGLAQAGVAKSEIDVKDAVTQAYYMVLVAEENEKVLNQSLENLTKMLKETEELNKSGFIGEPDVDQIRFTVSIVENRLNMAKRQKDVAYQLLKTQMCLDLATAITLTETLESIVNAISYNELSAAEISLEKHIDFRMIQSQQGLMKLNWQKEKTTNLPQLAGFFSYQKNSMSNEFEFKEWYPTTVWGLSLKVPIFGSGMRMYKTQRAKLDYEKSGLQLSQLEQMLKLQASSAKAEFVSAYESHLMEKKNLQLAEKIQNQTIVKYREGMGSSMELNQAQTQYLNTQGSYINSLFQLLNTKSKLDKALNNY